MSAVENVADVLDAAADLLEKPGAWTQGASARDRSGNPVLPSSEAAICFCAWGAIAKASGDFTAEDRRPLRMLTKPWGKPSTPDVIGAWNDAPGRTQKQVVAKLRFSAALARQEQAA